MAIPPQQRRQTLLTLAYFAVITAGLWGLYSVFAVPTTAVSYNEMLTHVRSGHVSEAQVTTGEIRARLIPDEGHRATIITTSRLPGIDEGKLIDELQARGVTFSGKIESGSMWQFALWSLPMLLLGVGLFFVMRNARNRAGPMSFGKSKAKVFDANAKDRVTFEDVAGVEEAKAELREIVSYLQEPERYRQVGADIPKGVLLVGPPGTGKTLLARAVAGEAAVPFFSLSGSHFMEMFVGVGASRVRDLFEQAKARAPCIIFIDEIDGIGRARGGVAAMGHGEQEQTLNQLLSEMDGFDGTSGVIIMAATNRPEILDPALVRAGRFDRQVVVDRPDLAGRRAVLEVHSRKVRMGDAVDLSVIARRTPGMVGADLARLVNEAALAAARRQSPIVELADFEQSVDRIQLGLEQRGKVMTDDEKRRVSYHESGHTLVAMAVANADPVHRVSIIPRSIGALGVTLQLPDEERYLMTKDGLQDRICVMLGGRVAEELECADVSTGASDDIERATEIATQMVTRFGMSEALGPRTFGKSRRSRFLGIDGGEERDFSEKTAQAIDAEVRSIIEEQYQRARSILVERAHQLKRIAERLLIDETLNRGDLEGLMAAG